MEQQVDQKITPIDSQRQNSEGASEKDHCTEPNREFLPGSDEKVEGNRSRKGD
jgi:hypothetical protein